MLPNEFKNLVLQLNDKLLRFAVHLLGDKEDAKDVVQEVFMKLWQRKNSLVEVKNTQAYVMQITRNCCINMLRNRQIKVKTDEILLEGKTKANDLVSEIELSETASIIKKLIDELPAIQRTTMYLRDIEQYEYEEIAEIIDQNINYVRVTLSRARKNVREKLQKKHDYGFKDY